MHVFLLEKTLGEWHQTVLQRLDLRSQHVTLKKNISKLCRTTVARLLVSTEFTGPTVLYVVLSPTKYYLGDKTRLLFHGLFSMNRVAPATGVFGGHDWSKVHQKKNFPFNLNIALRTKATISFKRIPSVLARLGLVKSCTVVISGIPKSSCI